MKRTLVLALSLATGFALAATAQTPAAPAAAQPVKIGVVAFRDVLELTNEGQRDRADLTKKYEPKRQQFKALSDEIENLTKQLQTQGAQLSEAERAARTKAIEDKQKQGKRFAEDAQAEFQQDEATTYSELAKKIYEVLAGYAKQQGFTLILDISGGQEQAPLALYEHPSTDITQALVDAYNLKSGVPPPPAAPANPAAAKPPAAH